MKYTTDEIKHRLKARRKDIDTKIARRQKEIAKYVQEQREIDAILLRMEPDVPVIRSDGG